MFEDAKANVRHFETLQAWHMYDLVFGMEKLEPAQPHTCHAGTKCE